MRIPDGSKVRTLSNTNPTGYYRHVREHVKWGVQGTVLCHHDSHGLCYEVRHEDGTEATYEPNEIAILTDPRETQDEIINAGRVLLILKGIDDRDALGAEVFAFFIREIRNGKSIFEALTHARAEWDC